TDGFESAVHEEIRAVEDACRAAAATDVFVAKDDAEREAIWRLRREMSFSLRTIASLKFNHDVVVPKGRIPELFRLIDGLRPAHQLCIRSFGSVGAGTSHVNIMVDKDDESAVNRVPQVERELFEGVVALDGSITGEHGIGFSKARYLPLELSVQTIALMKRV